jgi:hypothetical protein
MKFSNCKKLLEITYAWVYQATRLEIHTAGKLPVATPRFAKTEFGEIRGNLWKHAKPTPATLQIPKSKCTTHALIELGNSQISKEILTTS